jgi:hypothetical protein
MSMQFRNLAEQAMSDGAISADEVLSLRQEGWSTGHIDADEADAIFVLNDHLDNPTAEWSDFFVEAISEFLVHSLEPKGYVTEGQADWLIERIDNNGRLDSLTELELLVKVLEKATDVPERLNLYAIDQIEQAVLTGEGPTRDGGVLEKGNVTESEARLLRRIIFAQGSDRPAAVSQREAEMLFRLKDATLTADNTPEWKRLFVQGVGNYLQGFGGSEPLSRERAIELENFMNKSASSIGGFFGRMAHSNPIAGFSSVFGDKGETPDLDAEVSAAHQVTSLEQSWLQGQIDANGQIDEYDQALLDFLAEDLD